LASPVFGNFSELAPILIHVGSEEVLLSDSLMVAEAAGLANVPVQLFIAQDMPHVWHYMWASLGPARDAIRDAGGWMRQRVEAD
jgi:epsilon-lactone hydrolase